MDLVGYLLEFTILDELKCAEYLFLAQAKNHLRKYMQGDSAI